MIPLLILFIITTTNGQSIVFPLENDDCPAPSVCVDFCPISRVQITDVSCSTGQQSSSSVCCLPKVKSDAIAFAAQNSQIAKMSEPDQPISLEVTELGLKDSILQTRALQKDIVSIESMMDASQRLRASERSHSAFFPDSPAARKVSKRAELLVQVSQQLASQNMNGTRFQFQGITPHFGDCGFRQNCIISRYRTADGSCTNLAQPSWGKALSAFVRLLPPDYSDRINEPRASISGFQLPNARQISRALSSSPPTVPHVSFTIAFAQFGQFIDHDLSGTSISRTQTGGAISCCIPQQRPHPACFPIFISRDDDFYSAFSQNCINFVRSAPASRTACSLGPREQLNTPTSVLDGSMIYGNSINEQRALRTNVGGQLRSSVDRFTGGEFLPPALGGNCNAPPDGSGNRCFRAGDARVNENVHLALMHTLFLRMHNAIARALEILNPHWTDNILFEESRRIVGAVLQHFTYSEFLPSLLGANRMASSGLQVLDNNFFEGYDPQLEIGVANAFSGAAFRLHSLVPSEVHVLDEQFEIIQRMPLFQTLSNPSSLRKFGFFNGLIRGMSTQTVQSMDHLFSEQLQNHLFRPFNGSFGLDLVALNIQRGRDHGIPSYNRWREACGLPRVNSFDQLSTLMPIEPAQAITNLYEHVDDIDLFVGATSGETFACIVTEQFRRLKVGDRFFYENGGQESSFTESQLREIRKMTFARLLCDHSDNVQFMQPFAFISPGYPWNERVSCDDPSIPRMDLRPWSNQNVVF